MVDQKIAGQGGHPGLEAPLLGVEGGEIAVDLDEDLLGEIFGVAGGVGEAVADGVDAAVLPGNELLPSLRLARHALADQFQGGFLLCYLLWTALQ